jgi:hypothetical protein
MKEVKQIRGAGNRHQIEKHTNMAIPFKTRSQ